MDIERAQQMMAENVRAGQQESRCEYLVTVVGDGRDMTPVMETN